MTSFKRHVCLDFISVVPQGVITVTAEVITSIRTNFTDYWIHNVKWK